MHRRTIVAALAAAALAAALVAPAVAWAHPGVGPHTGVAAGFLHPLTGFDHVLAMVAVGVFAANLGGRALWAVPLSFMAVMALGGALGMAGVKLPFVETMIALSLVILGLAITLPRQWPLIAAMMLAGVFGLFHGHAHGSEMAATVSGLDYGLGFLVATGLLHLTGIGLALSVTLIGPMRAAQVTRIAGLMTAGIGVGFLVLAA